eukprot:gene10488-12405_t
MYGSGFERWGAWLGLVCGVLKAKSYVEMDPLLHSGSEPIAGAEKYQDIELLSARGLTLEQSLVVEGAGRVYSAARLGRTLSIEEDIVGLLLAEEGDSQSDAAPGPVMEGLGKRSGKSLWQLLLDEEGGGGGEAGNVNAAVTGQPRYRSVTETLQDGGLVPLWTSTSEESRHAPKTGKPEDAHRRMETSAAEGQEKHHERMDLSQVSLGSLADPLTAENRRARSNASISGNQNAGTWQVPTHKGKKRSSSRQRDVDTHAPSPLLTSSGTVGSRISHQGLPPGLLVHDTPKGLHDLDKVMEIDLPENAEQMPRVRIRGPRNGTNVARGLALPMMPALLSAPPIYEHLITREENKKGGAYEQRARQKTAKAINRWKSSVLGIRLHSEDKPKLVTVLRAMWCPPWSAASTVSTATRTAAVPSREKVQQSEKVAWHVVELLTVSQCAAALQARADAGVSGPDSMLERRVSEKPECRQHDRRVAVFRDTARAAGARPRRGNIASRRRVLAIRIWAFARMTWVWRALQESRRNVRLLDAMGLPRQLLLEALPFSEIGGHSAARKQVKMAKGRLNELGAAFLEDQLRESRLRWWNTNQQLDFFDYVALMVDMLAWPAGWQTGDLDNFATWNLSYLHCDSGQMEPGSTLARSIFGAALAKGEANLLALVDQTSLPWEPGVNQRATLDLLRQLQVSRAKSSLGADVQNVWATMCSAAKCMELPCTCMAVTPNSNCGELILLCRHIVKGARSYVDSASIRAASLKMADLESDTSFCHGEAPRPAVYLPDMPEMRTYGLEYPENLVTMWHVAERLLRLTSATERMMWSAHGSKSRGAAFIKVAGPIRRFLRIALAHFGGRRRLNLLLGAALRRHPWASPLLTTWDATPNSVAHQLTALTASWVAMLAASATVCYYRGAHVCADLKSYLGCDAVVDGRWGVPFQSCMGAGSCAELYSRHLCGSHGTCPEEFTAPAGEDWWRMTLTALVICSTIPPLLRDLPAMEAGGGVAGPVALLQGDPARPEPVGGVPRAAGGGSADQGAALEWP